MTTTTTVITSKKRVILLFLSLSLVKFDFCQMSRIETKSSKKKKKKKKLERAGGETHCNCNLLNRVVVKI